MCSPTVRCELNTFILPVNFFRLISQLCVVQLKYILLVSNLISHLFLKVNYSLREQIMPSSIKLLNETQRGKQRDSLDIKEFADTYDNSD